MMGHSRAKFAVLDILIGSFLPLVSAVTFPIVGRHLPGYNSLQKRDDGYEVSTNSLLLYNAANLAYYCNITVGGFETVINIDTGRLV